MDQLSKEQLNAKQHNYGDVNSLECHIINVNYDIKYDNGE